MSEPDYLDYARASRSLAAVGAMKPVQLTLTEAGDAIRLDGTAASSTLLRRPRDSPVAWPLLPAVRRSRRSGGSSWSCSVTRCGSDDSAAIPRGGRTRHPARRSAVHDCWCDGDGCRHFLPATCGFRSVRLGRVRSHRPLAGRCWPAGARRLARAGAIGGWLIAPAWPATIRSSRGGARRSSCCPIG